MLNEGIPIDQDGDTSTTAAFKQHSYTPKSLNKRWMMQEHVPVLYRLFPRNYTALLCYTFSFIDKPCKVFEGISI
jgi:hypothetical protein